MFKLNAAARIQMIRAQEITRGEGYSRSDFRSDILDIKDLIDDGKKPKDLGTKSGITLQYLNDGFDKFFYLQDKKGTIIGILRLSGKEVASSFLEKAYRGKGLGLVMYLGAVHTLGSLQSSIDISIFAVRTWKALSKYYQVRLIKEGTRRAVKFEWGNDAIPVVDGEPIDDSYDDYFFSVKK